MVSKAKSVGIFAHLDQKPHVTSLNFLYMLSMAVDSDIVDSIFLGHT